MDKLYLNTIIIKAKSFNCKVLNCKGRKTFNATVSALNKAHHLAEFTRFLSLNNLALSCCCLWLIQAVVFLFKYNEITFVRKGLHAFIVKSQWNPRVRFPSLKWFGYTLKPRHSTDSIMIVTIRGCCKNSYVLSTFRACTIQGGHGLLQWSYALS